MKPTAAQILKHCSACGLDHQPHALFGDEQRPRPQCVLCRRRVEAARKARAAAKAPAPTPAKAGRPGGWSGPTLRTMKRERPAPPLNAAVIVDCEPPITGIVVRLDQARQYAYVRTRYGTQPYGFAEVRVAGT